MRPAALLTTLCALSTSAFAIDIPSSANIGQLTSQAAALASSYATANPTSLYSHANSLATGALATLSELAATASGPLKSSLQAEYTSLKSELAGAQATASSALGLTGTGTATGSSSPASQTVPSAGLAPATAAPLAAVGLGMAIIGLL